jgi:lipid II:glycine glycyltransferase (peptidoglycan interpeptide bridge formation enzyme)
MRFLSFQNIDISKWAELSQLSDFANPFQTRDFYLFINKIPGFSVEVFAVEQDNLLLAVMLIVVQKEKGIKAIFSKRGVIYGGPLLRSKDEAVVGFLIQKTSDVLRKKVIYLETRNFFDYSFCKDAFSDAGWQYFPYLNFQINTGNKDIDELLASMKYNRHREVKLSIAGGATFELAQSINEVLEVYKILKNLYAERVKLPLPDFEFFKAFHFSDIARVFVVKYDGKIIAGSFCLVFPGKNIYTMYYCGFREINKKIYPTSLAVYAVIEYAVHNAIQIVDLMGAGQPGESYGVRNYKAQFGGELVEYGRFLKILNPILYYLGKNGLKLMAKLKS